MAKNISDYLDEYADKFGENFPTYCMLSATDSEVIKIIKRCLERNEPYEVTTETGVVY